MQIGIGASRNARVPSPFNRSFEFWNEKESQLPKRAASSARSGDENVDLITVGPHGGNPSSSLVKMITKKLDIDSKLSYQQKK